VKKFIERNRLGVALAAAERVRAELEQVVESQARQLSGIDVHEAENATAEDRAKVLTGLIELYGSRHAAEPDAGHDKTAAEWRAKSPTKGEPMAKDPP
jgi:hypothetical protein